MARRSKPRTLPPVWFFLAGLIAGLLSLISGGATPVRARANPFQTNPPPVGTVPMGDKECLACHSTQGMMRPLPNGDILNLTVDPQEVKSSVHGTKGYACVQCHTDIVGFPHPPLDARSAREVRVYMAQTCKNCHASEYAIYALGDHARGLGKGDTRVAVCVDCHGSHQLEEFKGSRTKIARTCQRCHAEIYSKYQKSVHGEALIVDLNPNVPTCIDCHNNHSNSGPEEQPAFRLFSPQICAKCHTDKKLMAQYGINTNVFDTYLADFHGTTVAIFEKISPDQETNKPVCIDCHGVHDIQSPESTDSLVFKQNLLSTCQRCHPGATPNFPDSWLSHYPADPEYHPVVGYVNLFYKFFIPGTIGAMALFVVTDFWRRKVYRKTPKE